MELLKEKLKLLAENSPGCLGDTLEITFSKLSGELVVGSLPVTRRVLQPFGILHGGVSVALAESVASIGAWLAIDDLTSTAVGVEINANHLKPVTKGIITATATPIRVGKRIQVWNVEIKDDDGALCCISRCTLAVNRG